MNVRSRAALLSLSIVGLALCAPACHAQSFVDSSFATHSAPAAIVQNVGPTRASLSVAARSNIQPLTSPSAASGAGLNQSQALMIVGGAAILVGAIVGDTAGDVFMVGGAVVGLYGLYKYLQ